jgi:hypothetical protein
MGAAVICATASGAQATAGAHSATARPHSSAAQTGFRIPFWMRTLATRYLNRRVRIGEISGEVAKHALFEWSHSRGEFCQILPGRFFCPARPQVITRWGIGYALSWNGNSPYAWTSPTWPRIARFVLTPGYAFWLTCYTYGDRVTDGGIKTSLWYRLTGGTYVNDGWVETGTNAPIAGMSHC